MKQYTSEHSSIEGRAVIFDLDGTIIDSEFNYKEADRIFLERHGLSLTEEKWQGLVGIGSRPMLEMMHRQIDPSGSFTIDELLQEKNETYLEIARKHTRVFPEMVRLIGMLQGAGMRVAIATGSSIPVIDVVLEITGLRSQFEVIASSDEVEHGKPAPDVFLLAAERLGVEPEACTVIEDSQYGVQAAISARMSCIAIPTVLVDPLPDSFFLAGLLFAGGMKEFDAKRALTWIMNGSKAPLSETPTRNGAR